MRTLKSKKIADGFYFTESARWKDGKLYFINIYGGEVVSCDEHGNNIETLPLNALGIDWLPDGSLVYVELDQVNRRLRKYKDGVIEDYCDLNACSKYQFNDLIASRSGITYTGSTGVDLNEMTLTTPEPSCIVAISNKGIPSIVAQDVMFPNGMIVDEVNSKLIVAETYASRLAVFDIDKNGLLENREVYMQFEEGYYPDGIAMDNDGGVWAAMQDKGCIRVSQNKEITHTANILGEVCVACAVGGENKDKLFLCTKNGFFTRDELLSNPRSGAIEVVDISAI